MVSAEVEPNTTDLSTNTELTTDTRTVMPPVDRSALIALGVGGGVRSGVETMTPHQQELIRVYNSGLKDMNHRGY
jgi:hypothetical protein